jgi:hypothetical protein
VALRQLLQNLPAREETRRHAEAFSWEKTTQGQLALFAAVRERHRPDHGFTVGSP